MRKFVLLLLIFFWPYILISFHATEKKVDRIDDLAQSDVAIIFGAHINEDLQPTEILQERLDAGIKLYKNNLVGKLIVSNTQEAALVMKSYLQDQGIPDDRIEVDGKAELTSDSCIYEQNKESRSRIFLTQGFHLNRVNYLCSKEGINGIGFPVELVSTIDKSTTPVFTKLNIRLTRFLREAILSWPVLVGKYGSSYD